MVHAVCLLLASSLAPADAPPAGQPMPPEIARELDYFVGQWALEGQGAKGPMKSSWDMRWAPGRQALLVEYRRTEPGKVIRGNALWGWDSGTGDIVYHALYTDPGLEHIRSKVDKDGTWKGKYTASLEGKKGEADCVLRKESPDRWTFKTKGLAAQGLVELDVRFTRVKPDADAATAEDYLAFWKKHFVGDWNTRELAGGWGDGTWSCRPAPHGRSMLFTATAQGKDFLQAVAGYDPKSRSWKETYFQADGGTVTQTFKIPRATLTGDPAGKILPGKWEFTSDDGKTERADIEGVLRDANHFIWSATNRVRGTEKLPDLKVEFTRRMK